MSVHSDRTAALGVPLSVRLQSFGLRAAASRHACAASVVALMDPNPHHPEHERLACTAFGEEIGGEATQA
jgi:hypothetical protein